MAGAPSSVGEGVTPSVSSVKGLNNPAKQNCCLQLQKASPNGQWYDKMPRKLSQINTLAISVFFLLSSFVQSPFTFHQFKLKYLDNNKMDCQDISVKSLT